MTLICKSAASWSYNSPKNKLNIKRFNNKTYVESVPASLKGRRGSWIYRIRAGCTTLCDQVCK